MDESSLSIGRVKGELTYGVFVLIGVNTGVYDVPEEIVHDVGEALRVQHSVKGSDENGLVGVEALTRLTNKICVAEHPRDHLDLQR